MTTPPAAGPRRADHTVLLKIAGWTLLAAAVVVGLLPVSELGRDCGSLFFANDSYLVPAACADGRTGRLPLVAILGIVGFGLLVAGHWNGSSSSAPRWRPRMVPGREPRR